MAASQAAHKQTLHNGHAVGLTCVPADMAQAMLSVPPCCCGMLMGHESYFCDLNTNVLKVPR